MIIRIFSVLSLVIVFFLIKFKIRIKKYLSNNKIFTLIFTETGSPTSLDPLDADNTNNISMARMLYSTPIEINSQNILTSNVLESFEYDDLKNEIKWIVKRGIKFSDGTDIIPEDIVFSITRMIHARPKFPVLENIKGVGTWLKTSYPLETLPSGIQINGNEILISFEEKPTHPLFRFCLEIFSIIPNHCVSLFYFISSIFYLVILIFLKTS